MKEIILKSIDNYELDVHVFEVKSPKAVIQLIHGMEEHQERYEDFAKFLNENGFTVLTSDMRGHGSKAKTHGFFRKKDGHTHLLYDQKTILNYIKENYKGLPIYLFAHSMGTIISRNLIQEKGQSYSKIVLSGYPNYQKAVGFGLVLTNIIQFFFGPYKKSIFLANMVIGTFARTVKNRKTDLDWISYNEDNVQSYINDPLCGFGFTISAYKDLFKLVKGMHNYKNYKSVNEQTPILLISGIDDPCTGGNRGRKDSLNTLQKVGYKNITVITYDHMRHEILNEVDHQKVYDDVINFYKA